MDIIPNGYGPVDHAATNSSANALPPHSFESESAVIGAFFQDPLALTVARETCNLQPRHFYSEQNQRLVTAIYGELNNGRALDLITLCSKLERDGKIATVGGRTYIEELANWKAVNPDKIETYCDELKYCAAKRFGADRAERIRSKCLNGATIDEIKALFSDSGDGLAEIIPSRIDTRFSLISSTDFLNRPAPKFLIQGHIVENTLFTIEGVPGSYKSFVSIGLAFSLAAGYPWFGITPNITGPVLYISAEGSGGLGKRIKALMLHHQHEDLSNLHFIDEPVQFGDLSEVNSLIQAIKRAGIKPVLIIVDTLSRCMVGGDENTQQDMGLFVNGVDVLRRTFDCAIGIVHHQGNNKKLRGSSVLPGAMEVRMSCEKKDESLIVTCEKMKDYDDFKPIYAAYTKIEIGPETDSLVFERSEYTPSPVESKEKAGFTLTCLQNAGKALKAAEWEAAAKSHGVSRSSFYRSRDELIKAGRVKATGKFYVAISEEEPENEE